MPKLHVAEADRAESPKSTANGSDPSPRSTASVPSHDGLSKAERTIIATGTVIGTLIALSLVYFLFVRDHWENTHRSTLIAVQSEADALLRSGKAREAKAKYEEVFRLVEGRTIRNEELQEELARAHTSYQRAADTVAAADQKAAEEQERRRVAREQEEQRAERVRLQEQRVKDEEERIAQVKRDWEAKVDADSVMSGLSDEYPALSYNLKRAPFSENHRVILKSTIDVLIVSGKIKEDTAL